MALAPIHEATLLLATVACNNIAACMMQCCVLRVAGNCCWHLDYSSISEQQLPATRNNAILHHTRGNIVAGNCCQQQSCLVYGGLHVCLVRDHTWGTYSVSHYKSRMVTFSHFVTYLQRVMCYWYEIHIKMILNLC